MFLAIQLASAAIVGLFLWNRRDQWREYGMLVPVAWLAEQSCISLYGFYAYDAGWQWFVGDVPVTVALIWPVVILTARNLFDVPTPWRVGLIVALDAAFIEVIAVDAGLWRWNAQAVLGVPLIGVLGWGVFAGLTTKARSDGVAVLGAVGALHLALLALWWGGLRWIELPVLVMVAAIPLSIMLGRPAVKAVWMRLPGALLFFVLVRNGLIALYALAFAVPYSFWLSTSMRRSRMRPWKRWRAERNSQPR